VDVVTVFQRTDGDWGWRRVAENGRIVATSGEGYRNRDWAVRQAVRLNTGDDVRVLTGDTEELPGV
jgi:uncharacterized protein YegP (UPF0339 family)